MVGVQTRIRDSRRCETTQRNGTRSCGPRRDRDARQAYRWTRGPCRGLSWSSGFRNGQNGPPTGLTPRSTFAFAMQEELVRIYRELPTPIAHVHGAECHDRHILAAPGPVYAAATRGDAAGVKNALRAGGSLEETDKVRMVLRAHSHAGGHLMLYDM